MIPARFGDITEGTSENSEARCYAISAIPSKFARVFPYPYFNKVQSGCLYDVWFDKQSLVVAAPTGSGKTGILELALCRAWEDFGQSMLAVYMGPTRSLVRERVSDWRGKFTDLGVKIAELTGDNDPLDTQPLAADAHLICTTPEKWDAQWRTGRKQVSLYLIDEVHSVGEPERGPLLEAVLTRTVVRPRNKKCPPRFIAVSATVANPLDIANWLGRNVACKVREFDASTKACPVNALVRGFPCPPEKSSYSFDIGLDFKLPDIINDHAPRGKSTLVFVSTRKAAVQCAKRLAKTQSWFTVRTLEDSISELRRKLSDSNLVEVVQNGVAFHHAGLNSSDRVLVEESFLKGIVGVLVTTTTLASGVNLPAYLVVIRGTTMYSGGSVSEYSSSQILQMIGRAGRIQFESSGQAVMLTKQQNAGICCRPEALEALIVVLKIRVAAASNSDAGNLLESVISNHILVKDGDLVLWHASKAVRGPRGMARYEALLGGKLENVESFLQQDLMRHLNAEIALGNVKTLSECVDWLKSTFFYARLEARWTIASRNAEFEVFVEEQTTGALKVLEAYGVISIEGQALCRTALGCVLNRSCLSFRGYSSLIDALRNQPPEDGFSPTNLLWLISALPDFGNAQIRSGEKALLRKIIPKLPCSVAAKPPSWDATHKTFILLQSQLASIDIPDSTSLRLERVSMMKVAKRASWCLFESIFTLWQQDDLREIIGIRLSLTMIRSICLLAKSCRCGMWYDSEFCAQQLEEIGSTRAQRLVQAGYTSFDSIANAEPRVLEIVTRTNPPFGSRLQQQVTSKIPRYLLHWDLVEGAPVITIEMKNRDAIRERSSAVIVVGDSDDSVHIFKKLSHEDLLKENVFKPEVDPGWQRLRICFINETIVGVDRDGIMERQTSSDLPDIEADMLSNQPHETASSGNRGRKSACNAWLVEELETAPYVESEDALSYIFRARAEELLRDYTAGDHQGRTKAINPNDSFDTAGMLDESPDSLDELLDSYYRDGGTKLTAVPQKSTTGAKKKTAKSRATKSKMIKRSVPNMKRAKTKKKSSRKPDENSEPTTIDADEVPSKSRGECSLVTNLLEAEYSEQKSKLENPTVPSAHSTVDSERRSRKPSRESQCVGDAALDDAEWDSYLRDTLSMLQGFLTE